VRSCARCLVWRTTLRRWSSTTLVRRRSDSSGTAHCAHRWAGRYSFRVLVIRCRLGGRWKYPSHVSSGPRGCNEATDLPLVSARSGLLRIGPFGRSTQRGRRPRRGRRLDAGRPPRSERLPDPRCDVTGGLLSAVLMDER
jgi:hypothetical protein